MKDVFVYDVNPYAPAASDGGPPAVFTKVSTTPLKTQDGTSGKVTTLCIAPADLHGRSMRLGPGMRITEQKKSVDMVLAQPPSHIDFVQGDTGDMVLRNVSFAPSGFSSTFQTDMSQTSTDSEDYSHGWSMSAEETFKSSLKLGIPEIGAASVSTTDSAEQKMEKRTENTYTTDKTVSNHIDLGATSSDRVSYDDTTSYLYVYEVVGQTVCPATLPNCDESARVPMQVMFSAPGPAVHNYDGAESDPWYQPVWENGNVLSYPANAQQLAADLPANAFTQGINPTSFTTTTNPNGFATTWSGTQDESKSVSMTKTFSEDSTNSIGISDVMITPPGQVKASLSVDLARSDATGSVKTKSVSISEATTIKVNSAAAFKNVYRYYPYVYGLNAPPNYVDPNDPSQSWATPIVPGGGMNLFGPMHTAFTVDPTTDLNQGQWWIDTYQPTAADGGAGPFDIALNHSMRWANNNLNTDSGTITNCITSGNYRDCIYPHAPAPAAPMSDSFHSMRGLFVVPTADANVGDPSNQGMQLQTTAVGTPITLEARVYNYSMNPMPGAADGGTGSGSVVHVRFFAMPWGTHDRPLDWQSSQFPGGASIPLGEWTSASGIPPFDQASPNPNWVMAYANVDPSLLTVGSYAFWVVAWVEDGHGNMLPELDFKGLNANPRTVLDNVARPTFMSVAALEPTVPDVWSPGATGSTNTSFSNNLGFFEQTLTVLSSGATLGKSAVRSDVGSLSAAQVAVGSTKAKLGTPVDVEATLHDLGDPLKGTSVYFYDGDPGANGQKVGARTIPYIDGNEQTVRISYTPTTCGTHEIYAKVVQGGVAAPPVEAEAITVQCDSLHLGGGRADDCADGGADGGTGGAAGGGSSGGGGDTGGDSGGGCSIGPSDPAGVAGSLFPMGAALASLWARRKRSKK